MSRLNTNLHLQTKAMTLSDMDCLFVATPKDMPARMAALLKWAWPYIKSLFAIDYGIV